MVKSVSIRYVMMLLAKKIISEVKQLLQCGERLPSLIMRTDELCVRPRTCIKKFTLFNVSLLTSLSASVALVSCQRPQIQSHYRCWRKRSGRGWWPTGRVRSPQDTWANRSSAHCCCDPSAGGKPPPASWSPMGPELETRAWRTEPRSDPPLLLLCLRIGTASSRQLTESSERKALWVWPLERKQMSPEKETKTNVNVGHWQATLDSKTKNNVYANNSH